MFDWIVVIVKVVTEIVRSGCDFLGWSTVWLRDVIKESQMQRSYLLLKTPQHLAVTFTEKKKIKLNELRRFLELCRSSGVRRVSLYDPWGECLALSAFLKNSADKMDILHDEEFPDVREAAFAVQLLGPLSGRELVLQSIRELLPTPGQLTMEAFDSQLQKHGVPEPNILLKIGQLPTMAGYPPLAIRVTEIVLARRLPTTRSSFYNALSDYSKRDIRLGK
ncbi:unnamed protein product, partial [Mesorhabditis spiculigera]